MDQVLSINEYYTRLSIWIENKLYGTNWLWKLTLCCALASWCLAVPPYTVMAGSDAWAFVEIQANDLLHPTHLEVYIRRENMVMRWMLPFVYTLTGHNVILVVVVQALLGYLFLYLFAREVYRQTQDKVLTAFFAFGLSNIFVFSWFFVDTAGYGDGFGYFFLMLALTVRNPALMFVCLQMAYFTDERAVIASAYVILWWMTRSLMDKGGAATLVSVVRSTFISTTWVVLISLLLYCVFRRYIMSTYFPTHAYTTMGKPELFADIHRWGLGSSLWTSFEGMWLLMLAAGFMLWKSGGKWHFTVLLAGFLILLTTGVLVHDINRALGYGFPFLLISSLILSRLIPLAEYRKLIFVVALVCLISPMCYTLGYNKIIWAEPLPMKALMALDRVAGWGWFD